MLHTIPIISINGVVGKQVSPLDRGFTYGDGVFETCQMLNAKIPLLDLHYERLQRSCEKLLIPLNADKVKQYLEQLIALLSDDALYRAVVKIIVTRGEGGRGYKLPESANPTICVAVFPGPRYPTHFYSEGVSVRVCTHRLSGNLALAGLKHLNRLEHILARAEWDSENIAEGLLFDTNDKLIEAISSNIFIVKDNVLLTPDLTEAGVAGVMRRFIIETVAPGLGIDCLVTTLLREDLASADEVFLCNSIFNIWPVKNISTLASKLSSVGKLTARLQQSLTEHLTNRTLGSS